MEALLKERLRAAGRRMARGVAPSMISSVETLPALRAGVQGLEDEVQNLRQGMDQLKSEVASLRTRVNELEHEMQESRQLNRRLAELTDVVQELLLPVADRDEEKLRELLERYSSTL